VLKSERTAESCLDCKALTISDVIENPLLELEVHLGADFGGDFMERTAIQFGCAVIRIEPINVE
jgi:hypothetical protein